MIFFRSIFSVGFLTLISRVTGYCRDLMIANFIGANAISDALAIVVKFPSLFRRLFAEGAFHVSFLPLFTQSHRDREFAGMILSLLGCALGLLVFLVTTYFSWIVSYIFPNLLGKKETLAVVLRLGPVAFPYIFFISLVSFFGSILNAYGRFSILALSHAVGNITVILWVLLGRLWSQDYGSLFAWGVLFSGVMQLTSIVYHCWRVGVIVLPRWPQLTPLVRKFLYKFFPGVMGVGMVQLNVFISLYLATSLPQGSVSYLNYADRLNQLPLSIIGVSLSSVLLPILTMQLKNGEIKGANQTQDHAIRFASLITLPAALFLMTLALPIITLLFGHGKLTQNQIVEIAKTLMAYSIGIPAYVWIKILNTRFFAHGYTKMPLIGSSLGVITDILLALLFIQKGLGHVGIALAVSFSAWVNGIFLSYQLRKSCGWSIGPSLWKFWGKNSLAGLGVSLCWLGSRGYCSDFLWYPLWGKILWLGLMGVGGSCFFMGLLYTMGGISLQQIQQLWSAPVVGMGEKQ